MKRRIMIVDDDDEAVLQSLRRLFRRMTCAYGILSYELEIEMFAAPKATLAQVRELELLTRDPAPAATGRQYRRHGRLSYLAGGSIDHEDAAATR